MGWRKIIKEYIEEFKATETPVSFKNAMAAFKKYFEEKLGLGEWVHGERTEQELRIEFAQTIRGNVKALEKQQETMNKILQQLTKQQETLDRRTARHESAIHKIQIKISPDSTTNKVRERRIKVLK